ncbi:hypothetical protein QBC37DRAFT_476808 [Rhypophila decipiens]|uniref:Uncharacterized protein n=1 Tax=Rhypophila decipiens TaxID=261697 RepID=A0AAN7B3D8_9PEZI|nr:hypothetical protein QBC37DRAFT_476808 [Rhypophila decipiens]
MKSGTLLVPYNDAMRLGDGYNSLLQVPCITNAVTFSEDGIRRNASEGTNASQQEVEYCSQFVNKISDFTKITNISAASIIKNGGDLVAGHSGTVDEAKFVEGDLKAIVLVNVISQTTELAESVAFEPLKDVRDSKEFFEVYGNCYISGFIQGGEFTGILSAKVQDGSVKVEVENAIKSLVKSAATQGNVSLPSSVSALSKIDTTITVAWSRGGQIKDPREEWTPDSLFQAAADFPSRVTKCPQTTWAIITPYSSNQSFVKWAARKNIKAPNFEAAKVEANNLLDMYMEYKNHVKRVQTALAETWSYSKSDAKDALEVSVQALLEARTKMKAEMRKIAQVVDEMNDEPEQAEEIVKKAGITPPGVWSARLPVPKSS